MEEKCVPENQFELNSFLAISIIISILIFIWIQVHPLFSIIILLFLIAIFFRSLILGGILIFLILAGIFLLPALFVVKDCFPPENRIKTALSGLTGALKKYETDFGTLPPHTLGTFDSKTLVIYLDGDKTNGGPKTAYFEFKPNDISPTTGEYLDPYKVTYHYRQPKNPDGTQNLEIVNQTSFDLWSEGKNSIADGDIKGKDDIANWEKKETSEFKWESGFIILFVGILFFVSIKKILRKQ